MSILRLSPLLRLWACFALFLFAGELVADSIVDAKYGCVAEASDQSGCDGDCATCLTCFHAAGAVVFDSAQGQILRSTEAQRVVVFDERAVDGPPARIDHPPQLG